MMTNIINTRVKFITAILCKVIPWPAMPCVSYIQRTVVAASMHSRHSSGLSCSQTLMQVAVEFLAPGLLLLAWSTILVGAQSEIVFGAAAHGAAAGRSLWASRKLWDCVGGFMAWWTCACWAGSTCFTVLLFRLGFLVS